jgi:hypothetical protein
LKSEILRQQRSETDRRFAEELGSDLRVEHVPRPKPIITVQNPQVVVCVVEDHLDLPVPQ